MKVTLMAMAAAFLTIAGTALAQTTTETTTTTTAPIAAPVTPPAPGTLSTTETQRTVDSNGDEVDSTKTTYGNVNGAAADGTTVTTMAPPPVETVTTTKQTTTTTSPN